MENPEMYNKAIYEDEPMICEKINEMLKTNYLGEAFKREFLNAKGANLYDVAIHCDFIMTIFQDLEKIKSGIYKVDVKTITSKNKKSFDYTNFSVPDRDFLSNHPDIFAFKYDDLVFFCKYEDVYNNMEKRLQSDTYNLIKATKAKEIAIFILNLKN